MNETEERISSIKIAKDFRLCQDKWCCWIEQEVTTDVRKQGKKTGETRKVWRRVAGYSPTYESLFKDFYQKQCFKQLRGTDIETVIHKMEQISKSTESMIHKLLGGKENE